MEKVIVENKLALFTEHWTPKIVGELNGQQVKLVKIKGEFVFHKHLHRPVAAEECSILLFEPSSTLNTGDALNTELTKSVLDWI